MLTQSIKQSIVCLHIVGLSSICIVLRGKLLEKYISTDRIDVAKEAWVTETGETDWHQYSSCSSRCSHARHHR